MWAFLEIAKSLIASITGSRVGQLAIVALVSWFWSAHSTNEKWKAIIAAEKIQLALLYNAELQRQKAATAEVEALASKRESENAEAVADMKATIEEYMKKVQEQPHVVPNNHSTRDCGIDREFFNVVNKIDAQSRKQGARNVRK